MAAVNVLRIRKEDGSVTPPKEDQKAKRSSVCSPFSLLMRNVRGLKNDKFLGRSAFEIAHEEKEKQKETIRRIISLKNKPLT